MPFRNKDGYFQDKRVFPLLFTPSAVAGVMKSTILAISRLVAYVVDSAVSLGATTAPDAVGMGTDRPPEPGRCYDFDGTDDHVRIDNESTYLGSYTTMTVAMSVKFGKVGNASFLNSKTFGMWTDGNLTRTVFNGVATNNQSFSWAADTWYRIVFVYNGTTASMYVNDVLQSTSGATGLSLSTSHTYLGTYNNASSFFFDGKMKNIQIWKNTQFSSDDVGEDFSSGDATNRSGHSLTTSNRVVFLKCEEAGATGAYDASGNRNHGIIYNATLSTFHATDTEITYSWQNDFGYGLNKYVSDFSNGVDDWTGFGGTVSAQDGIGGEDDTLELNPSAGGSRRLELPAALMSKYMVDGETYDLEFDTYIPSGNTSVDSIRITSSGLGTLALTPTADTWTPVSLSAQTAAVATPLRIYAAIGTTLTGIPAGDMIYIKNLKITATSKAGATTPRDESDTSNNVYGEALDFTGRVKYDFNFVKSNCLTFDGTDDYVTFGNVTELNFGTGDFTIAFWLYGSTSGTEGIITKDNTTGSNNGIYIYGSGANFAYYNGSTDISFGTRENAWHHYIITRSSNAISVYIDGSTTAAASGTDSRTLINTQSLSFGAFSNPAFYMDGRLAGVFMYSSALSEANRTSLYQGSIPSSPVFATPLAEGDQATVYDISGNDNDGTLTNFTLSNAWGNTQDIYHYNILNGFEHYDDDSTGLEILRVPYKEDGTQVTPTVSGYTKNQNNPAGNFHNDAETKLNAPNAPAMHVANDNESNDVLFDSSDVVQDIGYSDFEEDWNSSGYIFSDTSTAREYKNLLVFDEQKTGSDLTDIQTFLNH